MTTRIAHTGSGIKRAAVTYGLAEKTLSSGVTEYRVMHGNKIVARYFGKPAAQGHLERLQNRVAAAALNIAAGVES